MEHIVVSIFNNEIRFKFKFYIAMKTGQELADFVKKHDVNPAANLTVPLIQVW